MLLKRFLPCLALREYVRNIGIVHFVFAKKESIPVKTYSPRPGDSLEFFLREPEFVLYPGKDRKEKKPAVVIVGQHTSVSNRYVGNQFLFLNISFQPGVLHRLTGIPSYELANSYIDAEMVFSKEIRSLRQRLENAGSYAELISLAESYVLKLINESKKEVHGIDTAAKILQKNTEPISMDWLAKESCLCSKQFERKFKERMGISASVFARIVRFDRAFLMKNANPEKEWLSIAIQSGYYDYQHLVRDYKDFTGVTPTAFFRLDKQAPERTFGLHEGGILEVHHKLL